MPFFYAGRKCDCGFLISFFGPELRLKPDFFDIPDWFDSGYSRYPLSWRGCDPLIPGLAVRQYGIFGQAAPCRGTRAALPFPCPVSLWIVEFSHGFQFIDVA